MESLRMEATAARQRAVRRLARSDVASQGDPEAAHRRLARQSLEEWPSVGRLVGLAGAVADRADAAL